MSQEFRWFALKLVFVCVIVFILQTLFPFITDNFALISKRILSEPYLLLSSIFLHGGVRHLMFNMFALGLFGLILENIIGSKRFLIIFFLAGIISGVGSVIFYPAALGASGAIYGILGTLTVLRPKAVVWALGVPMPMFLAAVVWALMDLVGMFAPTGVANAAHLFGLAAGLIIGFYLRSNYKKEEKTEESKDDLPDEERISDWEKKWMQNYFK